jgi:hypothetical protein
MDPPSVGFAAELQWTEYAGHGTHPHSLRVIRRSNLYRLHYRFLL